MDDAKTFDPPRARTKWAEKMAMRAVWAATWIRHELYIGTPARKIAARLDDTGNCVLTATEDRHVEFYMLGTTGVGRSTEAALRHWCEIVEARP